MVFKAETRVGRDTAATTTTSTSSTVSGVGPVTAGLFTNIDAKLAANGIHFNTTDVSSLGLIDGFNSNQIASLGVMLKKLGYTVKNSAADIKRLMANDPVLIEYADGAQDFNQLASIIAADYLPALDTSAAAGPRLPSRSVYKYSDDDINSLINETYKTALGRTATPEELAARRSAVRPQLEVGTLSTTKEVKNKKTGKLEQVTVQTPGPSKTDVQTSITDELKKLNPDEADLKSRIDFSSWLTQNAAGA